MRKKTKIYKRCPVCGVQFLAKTEWQKYNKRKCRDAAFYDHRKEIIRKYRELTQGGAS